MFQNKKNSKVIPSFINKTQEIILKFFLQNIKNNNSKEFYYKKKNHNKFFDISNFT